MYSYEIEEYLKLKNYLLTNKEYLKIITESSQIKRILYKCYNDTMTIWTEDNYKFEFKLKK